LSILKRLDNILKISPEYMSVEPPIPKSIKIELTSSCNFKCSYCPITIRQNILNQNMDWDLFKKIAIDVSENGIEEVGLFLIGEPFMNFPLLIKAIEFCKKDLNIPYVFITSNASLASPDKIKKCMEAGLDSLKWSCNVADNEQFNFMINMPSKLFDITKYNIKKAYEIREKFNYKTEISASSILYDDIQKDRMKLFLNEYILPFVDSHYWLPLYTMGGLAVDNEIEKGLKPIAGNSGNLEISVPSIPCWSLFTAAHILVDGTMTACCSDSTGYWKVGDLKNQSFIEAWHSNEFKSLRKSHLENNIIGSKCEKCILYN